MGRINAGQLNQRIRLLTDAPAVVDGQGGYLPGGQPAELPLFARVRPLRGSEALRLGQELNGMLYEVTIRTRTGVTPKSRLMWGVASLVVQQVLPDEQREYLTLICLDSGQ
jgi:head-tail adaptor